MEGVPEGIDLSAIARALDKLPHMKGVHHVHAWTLTSGKNVFTAHLRVDEPRNTATVLRDAHDLLRKKYGFYFSTLQVETTCLDEDHARDLDISTLLLPVPARKKARLSRNEASSR
jgi:cobalt-zinc-cadmium efflux system protein